MIIIVYYRILCQCYIYISILFEYSDIDNMRSEYEYLYDLIFDPFPVWTSTVTDPAGMK